MPLYQATLESVLNVIGIDVTPFDRLNSWLLQQLVRNPWDMSRRLDDDAANGHDDTELNPRNECLLDNSGLLSEIRDAVEMGLDTRRRRTPQAQDPREDTCVICWDGIAEDASDILTRWPQCGHLIHRTCHSHWIYACHTRGNPPRCPICRRDLQGQPEGSSRPMSRGESGPAVRPTITTPPTDNQTQWSEEMRRRQGHRVETTELSVLNEAERSRQRESRAIPDMNRWAGILANAHNAQWRGKTDQLPAELVQVLVDDLCPASLITGAQHRLAGSEYDSQMGIECCPSDRDGITAAIARAHITARRQGDELPTILIADTGGAQVQQAIRQAQVSGRHIQIYIQAAGQVASAQAASTTEISCVAHETWGHRAMANMSRISAVVWPWCVDGAGPRFAQVIMASLCIGPDDTRTTEAAQIRVVGLPPHGGSA